jgi:DNA-binding NarL/FixJ family response regulator
MQNLTPRQREAADLVCQGLLNREIATRMGIAEPTVGLFLHQIYERLAIGGDRRARMRLVFYKQDWDARELAKAA